MYSPHWVVNGQRISSQINAWRAAHKLGVLPHFYFYEEEYDKLDWTKDPTETWDQLCYDRCVQLRQRYKKLSLFYSAGRDSHHVIRCFYHFNIPLDEIVLLNLQTNPVRQDQLIQLIYPQVHEYLKAYPNTKVKTVDVGPKEFDAYFNDDWLEKPASALYGCFQPTNFSFYVKQIMHADELSHGVILGVDKPRVILEHGKYYSTMLDKVVETHLSDIPNVELFYYAPTMPELHLKQSWMLLNHIERTYGSKLLYTPDQIDPLINTKLGASPTGFSITTPIETIATSKITSEFLIDYCGNSHGVYYDDLCIACGRGAAWNINLSIQNGKSKYKVSGRELIFQQLLKTATKDNWKSAHNFSDAMDYLKKHYEQIFNNLDPYLGTNGVYSKRYYMKDAS